ncbi:hypothetical protein D9M73_287890 [compost metagenome]
MPEATDIVRQVGQRHRGVVVGGIEARHKFIQQDPVLADQRALGAALLGLAEDVEGTAAQALQLGQHAEQLHRRRTELALDQVALVVAL